MTQFDGIVIPPFNSGYVNGLAVDSAMHIACTTTELDADVEFYDYLHGTVRPSGSLAHSATKDLQAKRW